MGVNKRCVPKYNYADAYSDPLRYVAEDILSFPSQVLAWSGSTDPAMRSQPYGTPTSSNEYKEAVIVQQPLYWEK